MMRIPRFKLFTMYVRQVCCSRGGGTELFVGKFCAQGMFDPTVHIKFQGNMKEWSRTERKETQIASTARHSRFPTSRKKGIGTDGSVEREYSRPHDRTTHLRDVQDVETEQRS